MTITFKIKVNPRDATRGHLVVDCEKGFQGACRFPIWHGAAGGCMWHWDGNVEKPSLSPSVACQVCGKHFVISNGEVT